MIEERKRKLERCFLTLLVGLPSGQHGEGEKSGQRVLKSQQPAVSFLCGCRRLTVERHDFGTVLPTLYRTKRR